MGNMGTIPATGYESSVVQTFSSPTGTSHTMTYTASVNDMILVINNVIQEPTVAYTTSGTTLTTGTLISGDTMYIIYLALTRQTSAPGADTVTNAMIVDNAINSEHYTDGSIDLAHMSVNSIDSDQYVDASIDNAHLADDAVNSDELAAGAVDLAHMSATGTASSSTFLRGDNAWAAAGGGAWTLIGTAVASASSSISVTGINTTTYDTFAVAITNMKPANDANGLMFHIGDSGGMITSGGWYHIHHAEAKSSSSSYAGGSNASQDRLELVTNIGNATGEGASALLYISQLPDNRISIYGNTSSNNANVARGGFVTAIYATSVTMDRVQASFDTGNITSGRLTVWGIKHT